MDNSQEAVSLLIGGGLLILTTFAGGAYLIAYSRRLERLAQASRGWPSVVGKITRASIYTSEDTFGIYEPVVEYTYEVAGVIHYSKSLVFGTSRTHNYGKVQAVLARFPVGGQATVYYDPARPSQAVLEHRAGGATESFVMGLLVLSFGGVCGCGIMGLGVYSMGLDAVAPF